MYNTVLYKHAEGSQTQEEKVMRKSLYGLLAVLVIVGSLQASMHHDKNFLAVRSHNDNMAMEYTTWHKQNSKIDNDAWDGGLQVAGFYQESTNKTDLGKYFGTYHNGESQDFIGVKYATSIIPTEVPLNPLYMIHSQSVDPDPRMYSYLKLRPYQQSYGIRLDYHQKMDTITKGLYFRVNAPIVKVKNCMGLGCTCTNDKQKMVKYNKADEPWVAEATGTEVSLADFLAGDVCSTVTCYSQERLKKAKIKGCQDTTGLADIEVTMGYNFLYKDQKHLNLYGHVTIPLGTKTKGDYIFEPIVGNHRHWGAGIGVDGAFELWKDEDMSLDLVFNVNYKYLFEATEMRTLGLLWQGSDSEAGITKYDYIKFGWYYLGGKANTKTLFPLANELTRKVRVTPGSQMEGLVNFAFHKGNFTFDLGYNFYAREGEDVTVREWPCALYGIARPDFCSGHESLFVVADDTIKIGAERTGAITKEFLTTAPCTSPAYVTHKVLGGAGYAMNAWDYPIFFGLGGSWEFAQGSNAALDGWALWLKTGVSF